MPGTGPIQVIPQRYDPAVPLSQLHPNPRNPNQADTELIASLLADNGFAGAVMAQEGTGIFLDGEHRWKIAQDTGMETIPVIWCEVTDDERDRFLASWNESGRRGINDEAKLLALLEPFLDTPRGMAGTAFPAATIDDLRAALNGDPPEPGLTDPDDVPESPAEPATRPGDVWLLGPHRIICGDSTDLAVWDAILGSDRPALVFTDPPYGIAYTNHLHWNEVNLRAGRTDTIRNDGTADDALRVTCDAIALFHDAGAHFVCCNWRSLATIMGALLSASIEPKACIVWDKQSRAQNLDRYAKQHEFIVYAGPYGGQPTQCTDVWVHPRDFDPEHPTPKPVSLIAQALTTASEPGALVADPFGGSGSTLIAAHQTGRAARVVELNPRYCDVICLRYAACTGDIPVLEATGEPFPLRS